MNGLKNLFKLRGRKQKKISFKMRKSTCKNKIDILNLKAFCKRYEKEQKNIR